MATPTGTEAVLHALAVQPAASFHEERVASVVERFLSDLGLPYSVDPYGNVIARYARGAGAQAIATVAHMDHPAFEVVEGGRSPLALLLGGVSESCFRAGTPVRVFSGFQTTPGTLNRVRPASERGRLLLELQVEGETRPGDWGVWEIDDFRVDGDLLHLRAADDLAGCAVALSALATLQQDEVEADVYAVFTRAEEVGLIGATLVAQQRLMPEGTMVVSLESSKVLPGVEQGAGPVIRVGDARRTFDAGAEALLRRAADDLRGQAPEFGVQRHLMSGGTCEATAFGLYGYATTGIALPLGNYHNQAEGHLAAEYIHRRDLAGAAGLLLAAIKGARDADPLAGKQRLESLAEEYRERLRSTAKRPQAP